MTSVDLSTFIKEQALILGFDACGIARADRISESARAKYQYWLEGKYHASMQYMERNVEKRYDPRLLMDGCRSIIVVALNYSPLKKQNPEAPHIAEFAYGKDYHNIIRGKLKTLLKAIKEMKQTVHGRAFADSAPITERYWAREAGLGWLGKNHHLILPGKGSTYLLGELLVDIDLAYDKPMADRCGKCRRCINACPTKALNEKDVLDANRCLSYLTIEKRGAFNATETRLVSKNNCLFGCDKCQEVCPWNRFSSGNSHSELQPKDGFLSMKKIDFEKMTEANFKTFFAESCLYRTGYDGFIRNLKA